MCLGINFYEYILFELHSTSWVLLVLCQLWEYLSHYYLCIFFQFHSSSSNSNDMNIRCFVMVPWILKALFFVFQFIFSQLFRLDKFYWSAPKFTNSILCHLYSSIEPINWDFLFWLFYFFSFRIPVWFITRFFLLFSIFFTCFKRICGWFLISFYDNCFKILVRYFNIWFMPVLAWADCLFSFGFWFSWLLVWSVIFFKLPLGHFGH